MSITISFFHSKIKKKKKTHVTAWFLDLWMYLEQYLIIICWILELWGVMHKTPHFYSLHKINSVSCLYLHNAVVWWTTFHSKYYPIQNITVIVLHTYIMLWHDYQKTLTYIWGMYYIYTGNALLWKSHFQLGMILFLERHLAISRHALDHHNLKLLWAPNGQRSGMPVNLQCLLMAMF